MLHYGLEIEKLMNYYLYVISLQQSRMEISGRLNKTIIRAVPLQAWTGR